MTTTTAPQDGSRRRGRAGSRGRIVMLVDNTVLGDSRVQKQARSAAEHGWNVILLGRSATKRRVVWWIGDAKVVQIPVPMPLGRRRHEYRRAPLRAPLAYPAGPLADHRLQKMRAAQAEVAVQRATLRADLRTGSAGRGNLLIRGTLVRARQLRARLGRRWVGLRAAQTRSLHQRRRQMTAPLDRLTTAFWRKTMGVRAWRRLDPGLWDYELAYGPVIDKLKPDIIHANDFRMLGVGARAVQRAHGWGRNPNLVWDAHEFLPGIKPWSDHPRWHVAQIAHEREYAHAADVVTTVSGELASLLRSTHDLARDPVVVLNAPSASGVEMRTSAGVRQECGLGADVALLVYSGTAAPQRGLAVMIDALPIMDDVHVALVVNRLDSPYVVGLQARATELGVAERVHVLPYVPADEVVPFLASADAGVIPIQHWPNHEIALITKFFEYSHARLPIIVSDVRTMADTVRSTGQGEVFRAEDLDDYVRAVTAVLADQPRYRAAYERPGLLDAWTWEAQATVLDGVYSDLLGSRSADVD